MQKKGRKCMFCDSDLSAGRAKEHVFPQWLLTMLGLTKEMASGTWLSVKGEVVNRRQMPFDRMVLGPVCAACNNGWMSSLESKVKPLIGRFQTPADAVALTRLETFMLAVWAVKTTIVLNVSSNYRSLFPIEDINYLYTNKFPPFNYYVDLLWHQAPKGLSWRQSQHILATVPPKEDYSSASQKSFRITFVIGQLIFRVLVHDSALLYPDAAPSQAKKLWPLVDDETVQIRRALPVDVDDHDLSLGVTYQPGVSLFWPLFSPGTRNLSTLRGMIHRPKGTQRS